MDTKSIVQSTTDVLGIISSTVDKILCDICRNDSSNTGACTHCNTIRTISTSTSSGQDALEKARYMINKKLSNITGETMFHKEDLRLSQAQRNSYKSEIEALNTVVKALFTKGILPLATPTTPLTDTSKISIFKNDILPPYYKTTQNY